MDLSEQTQIAEAIRRVQGRNLTAPLKHLFRDPLNVRKKKSRQSIEELAALIHSQDLLQNLVVRAELKGKRSRQPTGRYGVVAGGRRLEALHLLFTQGKIPADHPVRCLEVSQEDAVSVSLAENCAREPLHGADLFDAFRAMVKEGCTVTQIANAWGVSVLTVERRLKLAAVSPRLMDLYREDEISLEQMMALALVDDHATQEAAWYGSSSWERSPHHLRRRLTEHDMPATHPLARFVGLEAYVQAGGAVRQDLFAQECEAAGYVTQPALLERLALQRLETEAQRVRAEGWAWVEARIGFSHSDRRAFDRCRTLDIDPREEQRQRLEDLDALTEELQGRLDELDAERDAQAIATLEAQQEQASSERDAIEQSLRHIDPGDLPLAGVVVYVDSSGKLVAERGLVRAEDRKAQAARGVAAGSATTTAGAAGAGASRPDYSERLLRQLTARRTAALRAVLADSPTVALRVLAWQLALQIGLSASHRTGDHVEIRATATDLRNEGPDVAECRAQRRLDERRQRWNSTLPADQRALLAWTLAAGDAQVLDLLAVCTASTLNAVQGRESPQPIADAIAAAMDLDMADWWEPTAQTFLGAVPKAKIIDAVREAAGAAGAATLEGLKKDAVIAQAQRQLEGKRWLPSVLRARN